MTQRFSAENPPLHHLVHEIDTGKLGLPDLQRPFVWKRSRIRDLLDSLYKGFPAGYFLFWQTLQEIDSHSIGAVTDQFTQQKMIVNFNKFSESSLDFFVYTFTKTTDWILFHKIKQDVLLKVAKIVEANQAEIAFPTSTLHIEGPVVTVDP